MSNLKRTIIEVCILGVLSLLLAFCVNQVRERGHVKLSKNYFDKGETSGASVSNSDKPSTSAPPAAAPVKNEAPKQANAESARQIVAETARSTSADAARPAGTNSATTTTAEKASAPAKHLDQPYQEVDADQMLALLKDPNTAKGLNVIIDARNDEHFQEGHIPGAIQSFPYEFDRFRDSVMNHVNGAAKVVVYCGGGDCEDSIFMCRELVQAGVPEEAIYLFPGGYTEWTARKFPVDSSTQ